MLLRRERRRLDLELQALVLVTAAVWRTSVMCPCTWGKEYDGLVREELADVARHDAADPRPRMFKNV